MVGKKGFYFLIFFVFFMFSNVFADDELFIEDLDLVCDNSTREMKVYNKSQYELDDVDFCKKGETPKDDDCVNYQKIGGSVTLYDGPIKGFEKIYEAKLNKNGEFKITFGKPSAYFLEIEPKGNFDDFEQIVYVRECRVNAVTPPVIVENTTNESLSLNSSNNNSNNTLTDIGNLSVEENNLSDFLENESEEVLVFENLSGEENSSAVAIQKSKNIFLFLWILFFVVVICVVGFFLFELIKKRRKRIENKNLSVILKYIKKYRIKFKDSEIKKALLNSNISQSEIDYAFSVLDKEDDEFFDIEKN